jgi:hypothetical protein
MLQAIARLLGWAPRASSAAADLAAHPPPGLAVSRQGLGMLPPVLDPNELRIRNRARATELRFRS